MPLEELKKDSVSPLYLQLAERIGQAIQDGTYGEGERIPSEKELMERYGVSRVTVRLAMRELLRQGRIIRKQGMGTFVRQRVISQNIDELFGLFPSLVRRGLNPTLHILSYECISPELEIRKLLDLAEGDPVLRMVRRYALGRSILQVGQIYIPKFIADHWSPQEAARKNTFRLIEENAGIPVQISDVKIAAGVAKGQLAKWLECPKGAPLLQIRRVALTMGNRPVEYALISFRAESYEISTRICAWEKNDLKIDERIMNELAVE